MASQTAHGPALGILELSLISRGVVVADALLKRAEVELLSSRPVSGGKHLVIFGGPVDEAEESFAAGVAAAGAALVDRLFLPHLTEALWKLLGEPVHPDAWPSGPVGAVAIVETTTVCAAVAAADAAVKAALVAVRDMHLATGISGKAFFTMTGELHDIDAAAAAARDAAAARLLELEIIPAPSPEIRGRLVF